MKHNKMHFMACLTLLLFCLLFSFTFCVNAKDELTYVENEDGTYQYTYKSGTFQSNIKAGDTVEVGYFSWDENINITIMVGGKSVNYTNGDIIYTNGEYMALIYDIKSGEYTTINFVITNNLNISSTNNSAGTSPEDNKSEEEYILEMLEGMEEMQGIIDADSNRIESISIHYTFDADTKWFKYGAAGKDIYVSDIPNGAVTKLPVFLKASDNSLLMIFKDGELILPNNDNTYSEPGFYDVVSYIYNADENLIPEDEKVDNINCYITHFAFYIIPEANNYVGVISPPEGFEFKEITFDGETIQIPESDYYYLEKDGKYSFSFISKDNWHIEYNCEFTRDTVAPILHFNQEIHDNNAKAPISYTLNDPTAHVLVMSGDKILNMGPGDEFSYAGLYHFKVYDDAGNESLYAIRIKRHLIFFSKGMITLLVTTIVVAIIYFLLQRHGKYEVKD